MRATRARTGLAVAAAVVVPALVILSAWSGRPEAAVSAAVVAVLGLSYLVCRKARANLIYDRDHGATRTASARRDVDA